jgi:hypothetical protein
MTTTAEWVETNCNPLPNDNGFVAMPSTLKDSARFDAALSFLQKMFGWIMDEEHPTDSEVQEELRPYMEQVFAIIAPGLIVAALLLLCWLPLWIARCCAHRCCAPSRPSYGTKPKAAAGGCCAFWGLATLMCMVVGILCCMQVAVGLQAETCTLHQSVSLTADQMDTLDASVSAMQQAGDAFQAEALTPFLSSLSLLVGAFGTAGNVSVACAELRNALAIATNLTDTLAAIGTSSATTDLASTTTKLDASITQLCTTFKDQVEPIANSANSQIGELTTFMDKMFGAGSDLLSTVSDAVTSSASSLRTLEADLGTGMQDSWDYFTSLAPLLGVIAYAVTILLVCCGGLGALCMLCSGKRSEGCANGCGVCMSGVAWVGTSICSFLLLAVGALLLLVLVLLFDFGSVLQAVADPNNLLGAERCGEPFNRDAFPSDMRGASLYFDRDGDGVWTAGDDSKLNFCDVVKGCFEEPSVSMLAAFEEAFDVSLDMTELNATLTNAIADSGLDAVGTADVEAASTEGQGAQALLDALVQQPSLCETPNSADCPQPVQDGIAADLREMGASIATAMACIGDTLGYLTDTLEDTKEMVSKMPALLQALMGLTVMFDCGWIKPVYLGPFGPLLHDVVGGLAGLAMTLVVCGGVGILFIGCGLIPLQVYCGGVGKQPGCPSCCRCCCPPAKRGFSEKKMSDSMKGEVEVMGGTVIIV